LFVVRNIPRDYDDDEDNDETNGDYHTGIGMFFEIDEHRIIIYENHYRDYEGEDDIRLRIEDIVWHQQVITVLGDLVSVCLRLAIDAITFFVHYDSRQILYIVEVKEEHTDISHLV
jgi:hypothetical protein